jgi:hypothetical protein
MWMCVLSFFLYQLASPTWSQIAEIELDCKSTHTTMIGGREQRGRERERENVHIVCCTSLPHRPSSFGWQKAMASVRIDTNESKHT